MPDCRTIRIPPVKLLTFLNRVPGLAESRHTNTLAGPQPGDVFEESKVIVICYCT